MQNHQPKNSDELHKLFKTLADGKHPNALAMLGALNNLSQIITDDHSISKAQQLRPGERISCQGVSLYPPDQYRCSCCQ